MLMCKMQLLYCKFDTMKNKFLLKNLHNLQIPASCSTKPSFLMASGPFATPTIGCPLSKGTPRMPILISLSECKHLFRAPKPLRNLTFVNMFSMENTLYILTFGLLQKYQRRVGLRVRSVGQVCRNPIFLCRDNLV